VQKCIEKKCELGDLSLAELREFSPAFAEDAHQHLTIEAVLACHDVIGGTAPAQVQRALKAARQSLAELQGVHGTYA
jgi:argininosuccinate lyase